MELTRSRSNYSNRTEKTLPSPLAGAPYPNMPRIGRKLDELRTPAGYQPIGDRVPAPKGTPKEVVTKLNAAVVAAAAPYASD